MNVFDMIGPVMIGPSGSHTAGACRLGRVVNRLIGSGALSELRIQLSGIPLHIPADEYLLFPVPDSTMQ